MKKLLTLLLFIPLMFSSCVEDDYYEYYNPVEGEWEFVYGNGDYEIIYFSPDFVTGGILYDRFGRVRDTWSDGRYDVDRYSIYYIDYARDNVFDYELYDRGNTMVLTNSRGEWKEYRRVY